MYYQLILYCNSDQFSGYLSLFKFESLNEDGPARVKTNTKQLYIVWLFKFIIIEEPIIRNITINE